MTNDDLVTAADIARMFGLTPSAISRWIERNPDFPQPRLYVNEGRSALWDKGEVINWEASRPEHGRSWANRTKDLGHVETVEEV